MPKKNNLVCVCADGVWGRPVDKNKIDENDVLDMLREEIRIADSESLGHFEPDDCSEPTGREMLLDVYGKKFRIRCERL